MILILKMEDGPWPAPIWSFPELTDAENSVITEARLDGYAEFFPCMNGGHDQALKTLAGAREYLTNRKTEHFSIQCAHCPARLEFTVLEGQDEAIVLDNIKHDAKWEQTLDGLSCPTCAASTFYQAVL